MENKNINLKLLNDILSKFSITLSLKHRNNIIKSCKCNISRIECDNEDEYKFIRITKNNLNKIIYHINGVIITLNDIKQYIEKIEKIQRMKPENYWFDCIDDHHVFFEGFISINEIWWGS